MKWSQVPGAVGRLAGVALVGLAFAAGSGLGARYGYGRLGAERGFLNRAVEVEAVVNTVRPKGDLASLDVLYAFGSLHFSATGVVAFAQDAQGWGHGRKITLLVDPKDPDHPREAAYARAVGKQLDLLPYGAGAGLLLAGLLFAWELSRTIRSDIEPLRLGALVWLTPDGPIRRVFKASYYRDDVKYEVRARARPRRSSVRNGEKVLAAVVPRRKSWVRVIDEDLARTLGWFAD